MNLPANQSTDRQARWPIVLMAVVVFAVFGRLCVGEFSYWDDSVTVYLNPHLNPPTLANLGYVWSHFAQGLYIPVTYSLWMAIALIARVDQADERGAMLNPWMFHLVNVCVHCMTTIVVYQLLRRLIRVDRAALLGALAWALHPVQVEAVGWISGMKDVLAGIFGMLALWRFVVSLQQEDAARKRWRIDPIGTTALVLAMLSKPAAIVIPAIALTISWAWQSERRTTLSPGRDPPKHTSLTEASKRMLYQIAVWCLIALPFAIAARVAQQVDASLKSPLSARPMILGDTLLFYLRKLLFPLNLGLDYGRMPAAEMGLRGFGAMWLIPVIVLGAVFLLRRRAPWLCTAVLIFLIAILPTSGLFAFQYQYTSTTADHYLYLAMLGPALAIAFVVKRFPSRAVVGCVSLLVAIWGLIAFQQTQYWRNDVALFSRAIAVNPQSFVAHNNLGIAYLLQHNDAAAADEFRASIQFSDQYPPAYENLARALAAQGDVDGSIRVIEKSIDIRSKLPRAKYPNYMEDHNVVGQILLQRGRYAEAIAHFQALLAIKPDHADAKKFLKIAREKLAQEKLAQPRPATTQADRTRPGASG